MSLVQFAKFLAAYVLMLPVTLVTGLMFFWGNDSAWCTVYVLGLPLVVAALAART